MASRSIDIQKELDRIFGRCEDEMWDHCLVTDQLMTMRFECRPHKEARFDYFCAVFPIADALQALKQLPDGYGIAVAVSKVLFELPTRLPLESAEQMVLALAEVEGDAYAVFSRNTQVISERSDIKHGT